MYNLIKGIFIGVALVIPGLSASIFAVVVGLYDRLIQAVNNLRKQPRESLRLLLPVGAGAILGILLSTELTLVATTRWPLITYTFFIGLVLGSLPYITRQITPQKRPWQAVLFVLIGFLSMFGISQLGTTGTSGVIAIPVLENLGQVLTLALSGLFVAAMMTIPGISGAIMLMIVNQYGSIYNGASAAGRAVLALLGGRMDDFWTAVQSTAVLLPFVVGGLIGFLGGARLMGYILARAKKSVYSVVLGIVLAAVVHLGQLALTPQAGAIPLNNWVLAFLALTLGTYLSYRFD